MIVAGGGRIPARGKRTAITLVTALLAGAAGHVVAGGTLSGPPIAVAAALLLAPSWLMTAREQRFPAIAALLAVGQLSTHVTLTALTSASHATHTPAKSGVPAVAMLLAHLAATILLAWWLRHGERRIWAALRRCAQVLLRAAPPLPTGTGLRPAFAEAAVLARPAMLRHAVVLRGPPAAAV
jgi:hypothetical protein